MQSTQKETVGLLKLRKRFSRTQFDVLGMALAMRKTKDGAAEKAKIAGAPDE